MAVSPKVFRVATYSELQLTILRASILPPKVKMLGSIGLHRWELFEKLAAVICSLGME